MEYTDNYDDSTRILRLSLNDDRTDKTYVKVKLD